MNKKIAHITCEDNKLTLMFLDGTGKVLWDYGQCCCEHRYMVADEDFSFFVGGEYLGFEVKEGPNEPEEYGDHEVEFLEVKTSRGTFIVANHNEHSGYYGGFNIIEKDV